MFCSWNLEDLWIDWTGKEEERWGEKDSSMTSRFFTWPSGETEFIGLRKAGGSWWWWRTRWSRNLEFWFGYIRFEMPTRIQPSAGVNLTVKHYVWRSKEVKGGQRSGGLEGSAGDMNLKVISMSSSQKRVQSEKLALTLYMAQKHTILYNPRK